MTNHPFLSRIAARPIVADGAMGTMLYASGISFDTCFDEVNLTDPTLVGSIHRAYIAAGAELIESNSYGANRFKLHQFGLSDRLRDLNKAAVRIARESREVSGAEVFIAGAMGPTGLSMKPIGTVDSDQVYAAFCEQAEALLEGGVDLFTVETMPTVEELSLAVAAIRNASDLPIVAMLTFAEDGALVGDQNVMKAAEGLLELDVDVIGANCSVGPQKILSVMKGFARVLSDRDAVIPLACLPNAGWPTQIGGRVMYPSSPDYFQQFATNAVDAGVKLIGGCCGTTPDHTRAMVAGAGSAGTPAQTGPAPRKLVVTSVSATPVAPADDHAADTFRSRLGREFLVSVEIDPPKGVNPDKALAGAELLREAGVDAINVADSPMARVRMSAMSLCLLIKHTVGVETIVHFTTRDRSLMGIQSELLGAHAAGVRTILALTGDPPALGGYAGTTGVFDIDSIGLIRLLRNLNEGVDSIGASIGASADFHIACAVDPTRADLALEADRLHHKIEAGADFVMTQPIYSPDIWLKFLEAFGGEVPLPVMIGILPLQSTKHAEFLHNEVPGITLTDEARAIMKEAGPNGRTAGIHMAQQLLVELRPFAQGVYLMPSFGRYEVAAEVLKAVVTA